MSKELTRGLEVELSDGMPFNVEVTVLGAYDGNYGADADGNRGMPVWFIDDISFKVPTHDEEGKLLTKEERQELEEKLLVEVDDVDWEFSEEVDYEPDSFLEEERD